MWRPAGLLLFSLYLLPLGFIFRKHKIAFHCYADDTQVYVPLKQENVFSIQALTECLKECSVVEELLMLSLSKFISAAE